MKSILSSIIAAAALVFLTSCSTLPSLTSEERLKVEDVVKKIQCEMKKTSEFLEIYQPENWKTIKDWLAAFTLRLVAEESYGVSPIINLASFPILPGIIGANATINGGVINRRAANINFVLRISDLKKFTCEPIYYNGYPLVSELGILEWVSRSLMPFEDPETIAEPTLIGTTLDFIIDTSGRVTPGITILGLNNSNANLGYSGLFSGGRRDAHTLDIALKPKIF